MNFTLALFFLTLFFQEVKEVPYKPSAEFEVQIDFQFKQQTATNSNTINFDETVAEHDKKQYGSGLRPYLILNVKLLKLSDKETKARAVDNLRKSLLSKKVKEGDVLKVDMGFMDDVKGRVGAHEVTILFISPDKTETSRIHLFVQENGTFVVNGEIRGKF